MLPRLPIVLCPIAALFLGACAKDLGDYPSLERRPAERVTAVYGAPEAQPAPIVRPQPPATVLDHLDSLVGQAQRADDRFRKGEGTARRLVASAGGSGIGSEAWSLATEAVSELEGARGEAMVPLAALDRLYAEAMTKGEDVSAIAAAREKVIAIVGRHDQVLAELRGRLGS